MDGKIDHLKGVEILYWKVTTPLETAPKREKQKSDPTNI